MISIHAVIPGHPIGKERPRSRRGGPFYTPQATKDAEQSIAEHIIIQNRQAKGPDPKARFKVDAHFYSDRRSDLDNLLKCLCDGITKSGLAWRNDNQVDALYAIRLAPGAQGERTEVWVRPL